ncbi:MAG: type IV conjugative transfer system protein TraL [Legionellales bacterium]|nr:type IV conjugative transfer system protein TraL [Legionellales bacterium]|tara:strand:+ start:219 stop:515 length:297 start_codon:yes stop_codon:yes gene_type:complete
MREHNFNYVPKYLDEKERLFFWTMDEALVLLGVMFLGVYTNNIISSIIAAFVLQTLYSKIKKQMDLTVLSHLMYWLLPTKLLNFLKKVPDASIKEYIG